MSHPSAIRDELAALVEALDTDGLDAARARRVFEAAADIERLSGSAKTIVAKRLAEINAWQREGDRSLAHYVARKTGASLAQATDLVKTASRLDVWGHRRGHESWRRLRRAGERDHRRLRFGPSCRD